MTSIKTFLFAASACLLCAATAFADDRDFSGTVRKIFDGDSFLVRPPQGRDVDVRLQDIDAPEKDQPHGSAARAALINMIGERRVFVDVIEDDRYGRKVVRVFREPDRLDIAKALVRDGHAWVYRRTVHDRSLIELEEVARAGKRGLWALSASDRVPPWQHRYHQRQNRKKTSVALFLSPLPWERVRVRALQPDPSPALRATSPTGRGGEFLPSPFGRGQGEGS